MKKDDDTMKYVVKWHKLGVCLTTCLFFIGFNLAILFFWYTAKPDYPVTHEILNDLFYVGCGMVLGRLLTALITKIRICEWEHRNHKKLTNNEVLNLI
jgi:hypothetical protein